MNLRRAEISWQTQAICSYIAATVEDQKARDSMISNASSLTLLPDEFTNNIGVDTTSRTVSGERTLEDIIENGSTNEAMAANNRKGLDIGMLRKLGQ